MVFDQPVSVDIKDRQLEGAEPVAMAAASASAEVPKPQAMRLGAEKITLKEGPREPAVAKPESAAKAEERNLTSILAPVAGPSGSPSP